MTLRRWRSVRPVHWSWLHGPTGRPDPSVDGMSLSAARRGRPDPELWAWLAYRTDAHLRNEPITNERVGS